jgi:hypothetical protein
MSHSRLRASTKGGDPVKHSIRRHGLALFVVIVAAVVAACGQVTTSEEARSAGELRAARPTTARLVTEDVCIDGDPTCTPTGAHGKHGGFDCKVCHAVGGRLSFSKTTTPTAYRAGSPGPTFDAGAKTCSNVSCHGVPAGTYSYWFPGNEDADGDGYADAVYKTVNYGGTLAASTPSWYATGATCTACHGNPPANGSDGSNTWHSGSHANNQNVGPTPANDCELCHNIPSSVTTPIVQSVNGAGTAILQPSFHGNGTVNVNARFRTQCFGCH